MRKKKNISRIKNAKPFKKKHKSRSNENYLVRNKNNNLQKDRNLDCHYTEKLKITEIKQKLRRKKKLLHLFSNFCLTSKKVNQISPKNDNLNNQTFQVLKRFLCFETRTFKYPKVTFYK